MANNSTVQKVMHVSEEAAPAVHIPIMVGNEIFVLTQQDVRRVEDIRMLSYNRLGSNGQLCPVYSAIPAPIHYSLPNTTNLCTLGDLINQASEKRAKIQMDIEHHSNSTKQDSCPTKTVASVTTQLGWSKSKDESEALFRICYSAGTSTSGLMKNTGCQHCPSCDKNHSSCQTHYLPDTKPIGQQPPQNACCQAQTSPCRSQIVKREVQNASCQTQAFSNTITMVNREMTQKACCQTQTSSSQSPIVKEKPQNSTYHAQPPTVSTGCNTSFNNLLETSSAESYTSNECEYTFPEQSNPCRHCKSQQTSTNRFPPEQPSTSRHIHFDLNQQDVEYEDFERKSSSQRSDRNLRKDDQEFFKTLLKSRTVYSRALNKTPVSKPIKKQVGLIDRNPYYDELHLQRRQDSAYTNKQH
ncbi:LOW QUALITY PROTEIN: uncharacterized protein LOC108111481 [Drosophila eugracilis]|uniref:LOW QUALITY PROTEIN: uncharacterized protein LOC108111481 n=1 Tax=Drosophila eugracilis TaxID=29029 RepID=UPI001BDA2A4D|nr:LOW QUALITY PROTEIN: uncharacterized protein LOC108111481 [Drosophila eugracilis]